MIDDTIEFRLGGTLTLKSKPDKKGYCLVTLRYRDFTVTARGDDMAYTLPSRMQAHVQVAYVDASGNPATVDGDVVWGSSDDNVASVTVDPTDSTKATVGAVGPIGQVQVTASADADLGQGVRTLVTPMDVTVVAGEAVSGTISPVGPVEPIP